MLPLPKFPTHSCFPTFFPSLFLILEGKKSDGRRRRRNLLFSPTRRLEDLFLVRSDSGFHKIELPKEVLGTVERGYSAKFLLSAC